MMGRPNKRCRVAAGRAAWRFRAAKGGEKELPGFITAPARHGDHAHDNGPRPTHIRPMANSRDTYVTLLYW